MLLCDRDCGESLNLLLVCRWGAGVLKLIEELKDKKEECPEVGGHGSPWGGGLGTPHLPSSAELQISRPRPLHFRVPKVHSSVQATVRRTQASFRGGPVLSDTREQDKGPLVLRAAPLCFSRLASWPPTAAEGPTVPA